MTCSRLVLQTPGLCVLGEFREETEVMIPAWGLRARQPGRPGYASLPHRASLCPPVKWGCKQPWPPRAVVWVWCPSAFIQKACSPLLPVGSQPWAERTGNLGESLAWVQVRQHHHLSVSISGGTVGKNCGIQIPALGFLPVWPQAASLTSLILSPHA